MAGTGSWVVRGAVVAAAVVVGAGAVWLIGGEEERSLASAAPEGASGEVAERTEPPTAEEVAAAIEVEAGVTPGQVVACRHPAGEATGFYPSAEQCTPAERGVIGDAVSYGVVLENTGDQVVLDLPVTYRFVDDAGTVVPEPSTAFSDSDLSSDEVRIALWPGQQIGFGGMTYRDRPGATGIEVEVGEPTNWMTEMEADAQYGPGAGAPLVDVGGLEVGYGDRDQPIVRFDAVLGEEAAAVLEAAGQEPVLDGPMGYAVYRDDEGRIIGGADAWLTDTVITAEEPVACEIALDDPLEVPGIDPAQVEVHVLARPL